MKYVPNHSYALNDFGVGPSVVDWEDRIDPNRMREQRLQKAKDAMEKNNVDLVLCIRWENVRYLTGLRSHQWPTMHFGLCEAMLVRGQEKAMLLTMDHEHANARMPWLKGWVKTSSGGALEDENGSMQWAEHVKELLCGFEPRRIAVDAWSPGLFIALPKVFPNAEFVNGQAVMLDARKIKTEDEIKCMKIACGITSRGMGAARKLIHEYPGIKECEVLSAAFKEFYDMGAEWSQCANIVCSGPYTFPYRRITSDRLIEPGDIVVVDIGAGYNGYYADFTRAFIAGGAKPTAAQKDAFHKSYGALQASFNTMYPGKTTWDIVQAANASGGVLGGLLGHGDGLGAAEPPMVADYSEANPVTLEPGMIFSIEPFAGAPGVGGVRLEENILITENGPTLLSKFPYESYWFED